MEVWFLLCCEGCCRCCCVPQYLDKAKVLEKGKTHDSPFRLSETGVDPNFWVLSVQLLLVAHFGPKLPQLHFDYYCAPWNINSRELIPTCIT